MSNQLAAKPGAAPLTANATAPPGVPGKGTLVERTYLQDGALCDGPAVGDCSLDPGTRGRLMQLVQLAVLDQHDAFRTGASMAYTDLKVAKDEELAWYVELALDALTTVVGAAVGRALGRFGEWAKGARNEAYERLFGGEFVSERALALYGAVARVPVEPVKFLAERAVDAGKHGIGHATTDRDAAELLIRLLLRQAKLTFSNLSLNASAQLDDPHLLALFEGFSGAESPDAMEYRDAINARLESMRSLKIDRIGREQDAVGGGAAVTRAAVWVSGEGRERLAMVEHDSPVFRNHQGPRTYFHEESPAHNKFLGWVDDPTLAQAAEGLTRSRGDGNIGHVEKDVAADMLEGFQW